MLGCPIAKYIEQIQKLYNFYQKKNMMNHYNNFCPDVKKILKQSMPGLKKNRSGSIKDLKLESSFTSSELENKIQEQIYSYFGLSKKIKPFTKKIAHIIYHSDNLSEVSQFLKLQITDIDEGRFMEALINVRQKLKSRIEYYLDLNAHYFAENMFIMNGNEKINFNCNLEKFIRKCILAGEKKRLEKDHSQKPTALPSASRTQQEVSLYPSVSGEKAEKSNLFWNSFDQYRIQNIQDFVDDLLN